MFLEHIILKNFRGIDDLKLSFLTEDGLPRKWTFILGENGTGKSNLLRAIGLITAGSNAIGELIGNPSDWIKFGKDFCQLTAVLSTKEDEKREISLKIHTEDKLRDIIKRNEESLSLIDNAIEYTTRNYFIVGYGANRKLRSNINLHSRSDMYSSPRAQRISTLFDREGSLHPIESWAVDLDYRKENESLDFIKNVLNRFLPDVSFERIDKEKKQLLFNTKDGIIPLNLLSDGYQNMTGWLGDVLFRIFNTFQDYENAFSTRGILLIDELELHLHPIWQRRLIEYISEVLPNFQIIATTHSPLTAQQAEEGCLFVLKRDEESKIHLLPFSGNPQFLQVDQLITTPIFGVATSESLRIEEARKQYERLKKLEHLNEEEEKEFEKVKKFLSEMPDRNYYSETDKKQLDLLKKIESHLNTM